MAHILETGIKSIFGIVSAASNRPVEALSEWGDAVEWMSKEEGLERAKSEGKIILTIVQKGDCRTCERLKSAFRRNKALQKLSKHFVMINVAEEEVQRQQEYHPDGLYTPRILFFNTDGKLMPGVKRDPTLTASRYSYRTEAQLMQTMKKVLEEPSRYVKMDHPRASAQNSK